MQSDQNVQNTSFGDQIKNFAKAILVISILGCLFLWFQEELLFAVLAGLASFVQALLLFSLGHFINLMEENNRLLDVIAKKA